ncbi:hypothetical protein HDV03_000699 [Kappamyces sp. JEL0829]|nr:hypothetical protein HDV03_000699 [Kappamyces sp. JEL0829]
MIGAILGSSQQKPTAKESPRRPSTTNSFGPYRLGKTIGQGEFGKVKLGYHLQSNREVAIKFIKKQSVDSAVRRTKLAREINILQSISHRYIVELLEVIETEAYIGLIMEVATGGELFEYILSREYLSEREAGRIFAQLIDAVSYLHARGIIHRDLKLENVLLDRNRNVKLIDFGFANTVNDHSQMLQTSCGSPCYAAPELVSEPNYNGELADIWSCGVILYAMLCGTLPFDDDPNNENSENLVVLYRYIMETKLSFPVPLSSGAVHLVNRILNINPKIRASLVEIKSHQWLKPYVKTFQRYSKEDASPAEAQPASPMSRSLAIDIPTPNSQNDPEEVKSQTAERSPLPVDVSPLSPASPFDETKLGSPLSDVESVQLVSSNESGLVKSLVDELAMNPIDVLSVETQAVATPDAEDRPDATPVEVAHQDLRTQPIPTLEIIMEEDDDKEMVQLPISSKPSLASMASKHRLHRKSTISFVVVEKPSKMSILDDNVGPITVDALLDPQMQPPLAVKTAPAENDEDSHSSASTVKKVNFPVEAEKLDAEPSKPSGPVAASSPPPAKANRTRQSLNIYSRTRESQSFKEQAIRTQSLDVRRGSETPSMASNTSQMSKTLGVHSGPIDQRAISVMRPHNLIEKICQVLNEMDLDFSFSDDPYKLVVVKSEQSSDEDESGEIIRDSLELARRDSRLSRTSRVSARSLAKKSGLGASISSLFQKIKYISTFGLQYNRGYDGTSVIPPARPDEPVNTFVKFHVVISRIRNINGVYIVDLKRHKGDIWEFKRIYNEIILRLDLKGDLA